MGTREQRNTNFVIYMMKLVVAIVEGVVFALTDLSPFSGIIMVLSSMTDDLENFTKGRDETNAKMQLMNWIVFGISMVSLVLFVLTAIGFCDARIAGAILTIAIPVKLAFYVGFNYLKKGNNKK